MSVMPSLSIFNTKGTNTAPQKKKLSELNKDVSRMVDTFIYPYPDLVRENKNHFADVTDKAKKEVRVAIIGTGFSGFTAAYELSRAGIENIDMYEARDKIGGRANTEIFKDDTQRKYPCEMGAMRVPENSKLFWHYLSELQGEDEDPSLTPFPNPGVVLTGMLFQQEKFIWKNSTDLPEDWINISNDFQEFCKISLTYHSEVTGEESVTLERIQNLLTQETLTDGEQNIISTYWEHFLEKYQNVSFVEALTQFMDGKDERPFWGPKEFDKFSTLGLGTGGFGPVFPVCFLEIFRLLLWKYDDEYTPHLTMVEIIEKFNCRVKPNIKHQTVTYVGIDKENSNKINLYAINDKIKNRVEKNTYDYVIVATTLRSMQITMNLDGANSPSDYSKDSTPIFSAEHYSMLRQSIRVPHIINSSKLFGFLPKKPWIDNDKWPCDEGGEPVKCLLTDTLARQMYFLDPYPEDDNAGVNVLISYNWGDDSVQMMAIENYSPNQKLDPDENSDYTLKLAYQNDLETTAYKYIAETLKQIKVGNQESQLKSIFWQKEPMAFGAFKLDYPHQYQYTSQLVYQYKDEANAPNDSGYSKRVFLANNNCSFQGGWIEGAMQSAVNGAAGVLKVMADNGEIKKNSFRMEKLFKENPFQAPLGNIIKKYHQ